MNPFKLVADSPHKPWLRLGLGLLGGALLVLVARRVHWHSFLQAVAGLRWGFLVLFVLLGAASMALRAVRLRLIFGASGRFVPVFRGVALGYLGMLVLPLGAGELLKMASLRSLLGLPASSVATAWVLDRVFEVVGVLVLLGLLAGLGVAVHFQAGGSGAMAGVLVVLALALLAGLVLRRRLRQAPPEHGSALRRRLDAIASVLAVLKRPSQVLSLLGVQLLVSAMDALGLFVCFHAFTHLAFLSLLTAVKLNVFLMVGAALPLLPGGMGTHQVACLLALQPLGITASLAFAFSVVAQGSGFILMGVLGLAAAVGPWGAEPS